MSGLVIHLAVFATLLVVLFRLIKREPPWSDRAAGACRVLGAAILVDWVLVLAHIHGVVAR